MIDNHISDRLEGDFSDQSSKQMKECGAVLMSDVPYRTTASRLTLTSVEHQFSHPRYVFPTPATTPNTMHVIKYQRRSDQYAVETIIKDTLPTQIPNIIAICSLHHPSSHICPKCLCGSRSYPERPLHIHRTPHPAQYVH